MTPGLYPLEHPTCRSVLEARPTAFWVASSILFSEEPATWIIR
jgi:hypothetical protein